MLDKAKPSPEGTWNRLMGKPSGADNAEFVFEKVSSENGEAQLNQSEITTEQNQVRNAVSEAAKAPLNEEIRNMLNDIRATRPQTAHKGRDREFKNKVVKIGAFVKARGVPLRYVLEAADISDATWYTWQRDLKRTTGVTPAPASTTTPELSESSYKTIMVQETFPDMEDTPGSLVSSHNVRVVPDDDADRLADPVTHLLQAKNLPGSHMFYASEKMADLWKKIELLADKQNNVLIRGETGSGKELVARALHGWLSKRKHRDFLAVNCSTLTPSLADSQLFGHTKGAFTGATDSKEGLCGAVGEGTLFLDEVGELNEETQPKLLRLMENGEYIKVGRSEVSQFKGRIVAGTNKDITNGENFRDDLLHRFDFTLQIPPLRERADIQPLAEYLLGNIHREMELTASACEKLLAHSWPGNVRELDNVLTNAAFQAELDGARRLTEEYITFTEKQPG